MSDLALLVLLDAFRPDYLWRTEFLRDLARRSATGSMEEPFGFVPRAAYFGGLSPNQAGYANMFARDGWRSPFPLIPALDRVARLGDRDALRHRSLEEAAARVPDFAARYVDGFNLGLGVLPSLAFTETQPPWGPRCPYRSLFHILDDHGLRWIQCAWPYTRVVADADAGIVGACLDQLTEDTRFAFVHLSALDAVGHQFGPGSPQLQRALGEVNRACAVLFNAAHERFDRVRMLIFGDHGMVSVVRSVDVLATLPDTGLATGIDYDVFVDSPMARFWFHHGDARAGICRHLATLDAGRVLTTADLARYEAERMPSSNGQLFYVAHPGVVFAPNAFQPDGDAVRGMHGYLPDVADNRGGLLLYDSAVRQPRSLGVVAATQLFPTCLQLCGLDSASHTARPPIAAQPATARWTAGGDPTCEARVEADLLRARAMIAARAPASTIVVTGSFGRGEGGVVRTGDRLDVLNDYDFVVVGPDAVNAAGIGPALARAVGTDFCDVMPIASVEALAPAQFHFDLRYGSRIVAGDRRLLDRIPPFAAGDVPAADAARLLMNRIAGVMLVPLSEQHGEIAPLSQFAVNQIAKALTAVGDAHLILVGDYSTRLAERAARFSALLPALRLSGDWVRSVEAAYAYKLTPTSAPGPFRAEHYAAVRPAIGAALRAVAAAGGHDNPDEAGWRDAVSAVIASVADTSADDEVIAAQLRNVGFMPSRAADGEDAGLRRTVLEGLRDVFRVTATKSGPGEAGGLERRLACLGAPIGPGGASPFERLELARRHLSTAWLATCH